MTRARLNIFIEPEHAKRLDQIAAHKGVSKSAVYSFVGVAVSSVAILAALLAVYVRRPVDAAAGAAVRTFHIAVVSLASRPPDTPAS